MAAVALRAMTAFLEWKVVDQPKIHIARAGDRFTAEGALKAEVRQCGVALMVGGTSVGEY